MFENEKAIRLDRRRCLRGWLLRPNSTTPSVNRHPFRETVLRRPADLVDVEVCLCLQRGACCGTEVAVGLDLKPLLQIGDAQGCYLAVLEVGNVTSLLVNECTTTDRGHSRSDLEVSGFPVGCADQSCVGTNSIRSSRRGERKIGASEREASDDFSQP